MIQARRAVLWAPHPGPAWERLRSQARTRGALFAAAALFLALVAVYLFSAGIRATRGASITGDEPFYVLTTQSIIEDGDLDLRNQYAARSYESFFDHPDGLWKQSIPLPDGRLLSPHNPGLSALVIPGFALGGLAGAQVACLAAYGILITAGLTRSALIGEVTIAVDPFDMSYPLFQGMSWLFPDYRVWTWETWGLTTVWLILMATFVAAAVRYSKSGRSQTK